MTYQHTRIFTHNFRVLFNYRAVEISFLLLKIEKGAFLALLIISLQFSVRYTVELVLGSKDRDS